MNSLSEQSDLGEVTGMPAYNDDNIFAKILRGEIPNSTVVENDHALAFRDIAPAAPSHVLVIPKGKYVTFHDFARKGSKEEHSAFVSAVADVVEAEGLAEDGYRLIVNNGPNGRQEVPHIHIHVLGGRDVGPMVKRWSKDET
jgi:histidine triad (HIT) family protein